MGRQLEQSHHSTLPLVTTKNWGSVSVPDFSFSGLRVFANTCLCFWIYFMIASATICVPCRNNYLCSWVHAAGYIFASAVMWVPDPSHPLTAVPVTLTPFLWGVEKNIFFPRPIQLGKEMIVSGGDGCMHALGLTDTLAHHQLCQGHWATPGMLHLSSTQCYPAGQKGPFTEDIFMVHLIDWLS